MDKTPQPQEEEPLLDQDDPFEIPVWFRIVCCVVALSLIGPATALFIRYTLEPERFATPSAWAPPIRSGRCRLVAVCPHALEAPQTPPPQSRNLGI